MVGTPVTCDEKSDRRDWGWTKDFMRLLGPEHVMGFAVGNELELLYKHHHTNEDCIRNMWDEGRLWDVFQQYVGEIDSMGFSNVPITSVFTAGVVYSGDVNVPFVNIPGQAMVNTFLWRATVTYS